MIAVLGLCFVFLMSFFVASVQATPIEVAEPETAGVHKITAIYYQAYIYDDHDDWPKGGGEWYFDLYGQGQPWVGEAYYFRDGAGWADFSDRIQSWQFSGTTYFRMWAGEDDTFGWDDDSISYKDVDINWPWPTTNMWHYGQGLGIGGKGWDDVRHYYRYYIENKRPSVNSISGPTSGTPPQTYTYTATGSDPEGDSYTYYWTVNGVVQSSTSSTMTYTFSSSGTYTIRVWTKDYFGLYSSTYKELKVSMFYIVMWPTVTAFSFSPNPANPGQIVTLSGTLKTSLGSPVSGASIKVEYGTTLLWTLTTNTVGQFSKTFTAPSVGNYLVKCSYAGSTTLLPSSDTETLVVQTAGPKDTKISLSFSPNPVNSGQTVTLSGTLKDVGGNPVYPAQVKVYYSLNGGISWNYIWTLTTNAAGQFSKTFTAPGSGTYLVGVYYPGSTAYKSSTDTENLYVT